MANFLLTPGLRPLLKYYHDAKRRVICAVLSCPLLQYPSSAPPAVTISASCRGADAQTSRKTR